MTDEDERAILIGENTRQREQIAELVAQHAALAARIQFLDPRLAKDSHNSSKPPSSDGPARKTKRLRRRSGKRAGGQLGHRGETLRLVATPDTVVEHRPRVCAACQGALDEAAVVGHERRQVYELPALRLVVREPGGHQAANRYSLCNRSGQVSALFLEKRFTSKVVLILGRPAPARKYVPDSVRVTCASTTTCLSGLTVHRRATSLAGSRW